MAQARLGAAVGSRNSQIPRVRAVPIEGRAFWLFMTGNGTRARAIELGGGGKEISGSRPGPRFRVWDQKRIASPKPLFFFF